MQERNIIQKLIHLWGRLYLKRKIRAKQRKSEFVSFDDARIVGLLYSLDSVATYECISAYVHKLQDENKKVKAIGLVKKKEDTNRFLPKLSFDFIYTSDINWFGKPSGTYAHEFMNLDFDILIDISEKDDYTAEYLLSLSSAKLKAGQSNICDIMIKQKQGIKLEDYIQEIDHYLRIIKKK